MNRFAMPKPFGKTTYTLSEDGILVEDQGLLSHSRYSVPFDSIEHTPNITTTSSPGLFWSTIVFLLLTGVVVVDYFFGSDPSEGAIMFWGTFAVVFGLFYLSSRKTLEYFPSYSSQPIVFRYPKRKRKELDGFRESFNEAKIRFLIDRISSDFSRKGFDESIDYAIRLRNARIVNRGGFATLENHIETLSQAKSASYGFGIAQPIDKDFPPQPPGDERKQ